MAALYFGHSCVGTKNYNSSVFYKKLDLFVNFLMLINSYLLYYQSIKLLIL